MTGVQTCALPISILEIVLKQARAIADISGKRELIQQLDIDEESIEYDEDGFNSDVSLDFHPVNL